MLQAYNAQGMVNFKRVVYSAGPGHYSLSLAGLKVCIIMVSLILGLDFKRVVYSAGPSGFICYS